MHSKQLTFISRFFVISLGILLSVIFINNSAATPVVAYHALDDARPTPMPRTPVPVTPCPTLTPLPTAIPEPTSPPETTPAPPDSVATPEPTPAIILLPETGSIHSPLFPYTMGLLGGTLLLFYAWRRRAQIEKR